jgi:hypothetical protein
MTPKGVGEMEHPLLHLQLLQATIRRGDEFGSLKRLVVTPDIIRKLPD